MKNILNQLPTDTLIPRLKFTLKFVDLKDIRKKKILDIGCGFGWFELNAIKRGAREIWGIEISDEDLIAAKHIKDKRVNFKVGGALGLPFKQKYFDTLVAWEVIEHIPNETENKMFKEAARVLKTGGVFYLSTPYGSLRSKMFDPAWWLIGHRHYKEKKLISLGDSNGFIVKKIKIKGRWWSIFNLLNMYLSKWILRRDLILKDKLLAREDREYFRNGFVGIFIKYEKI